MNEKIKKIYKYIKGAGIKYALYGIKYKFTNPTDYSRIKYGKKKFIYSKIKRLVKKYKRESKSSEISINNNNKKHLQKFPIWICWFQGIENAPEIVKICLQSLKENISSDSEIHIITFDNLEQYVEIPQYIVKKREKGIITLTQYSDIIRFALLSKYGGFWLDSTVLVTDSIINMCNYDYYTKKSDRLELNFGNYLIQGRFTAHINKGDNDNVLYNFIYDSFLEYYKKVNVSIDYFLVLFFADIAYENIPQCRTIMDNLSYNDKGMESRLCEILNEEYNEIVFNQLKENMPFQKLSYKLDNLCLYQNNQLTYYGYIYEKYKNKI